MTRSLVDIAEINGKFLLVQHQGLASRTGKLVGWVYVMVEGASIQPPS